MTRLLRAAAVAVGLAFFATPSVAFMHGMMMGMDDAEMYNLTLGGLSGGDDARGVDEAFRDMAGVDRVHVDFDNGMIMIWMKDGEALDRPLAKQVVEAAGFTLNDFESPE